MSGLASQIRGAAGGAFEAASEWDARAGQLYLELALETITLPPYAYLHIHEYRQTRVFIFMDTRRHDFSYFSLKLSYS